MVAGREPVTSFDRFLFVVSSGGTEIIIKASGILIQIAVQPESLPLKISSKQYSSPVQGRHLEKLFYSNLFLFRRFQASNYQASPMKIAEPAVDLLSLGETPLDA